MGLWKDTSRETRQLKKDYCSVLGDGSKIRFREDTWYGENVLCETFPSLFVLADSEGAMMVNVWVTSRRKGFGILDL